MWSVHVRNQTTNFPLNLSGLNLLGPEIVLFFFEWTRISYSVSSSGLPAQEISVSFQFFLMKSSHDREQGKADEHVQ